MKQPILRKTSKAWLAKLLAGAGGLLAATISLGYSLYEERESESIPQVEISTPVEAGRWKVTVAASFIIAAMPNGGRISPDKKAIAVDMMPLLEQVNLQRVTDRI